MVGNAAKYYLIKLEFDFLKILKDREEYWRLESQSIWLKAGDENTKFFQH